MKNFMQYAPTEIVFGKDAEKEAGRHKQRQAENPKTSNELSLLINKHIETKKTEYPPIAYNTKQNRI